MKASRRAKKKGPDSHYIPRVVLRNWRWRDGRLRYLDLSASHGRLQRSYPDSYSVSPEPFPSDVETALGALIETPIGDYLARVRRGGDTDFTPREQRAMALWLLGQGAMTHAGTSGSHAELSELILKGDAYHDAMAAAFFRFATLGHVTSTKPLLFLPSTGLVALPLAREHGIKFEGQQPPFGDEAFGWLIPVTPTMAITHMPLHSKLLTATFWDDWLPFLSIGLRGDQVLLPPEQRITLEDLATRRATVRAFCQRVYDLNVAELEFVREREGEK